jgi:G3E family GTPase
MSTTIACIGGFLGAGKTTAVQAAAAELKRRGQVASVITNDQGNDLVDTEVIRRLGIAAAEITGGCFCCKFEDLIGTMTAIVEQHHPDIILAEAVGSCTDLSATVYQPLRRYYPEAFALAPLSVLVEPRRIRALRHGGAGNFPEEVGYLFEKQLAEADLIVLNKLDTIDLIERREITRWLRDVTGGVPVHAMSARNRIGVAAWIERLLSGDFAGGRLLDINYDVYAAAESALGWLNATLHLTATHSFSPKDVATAFVARVQQAAGEASMAVAHLKVLVASGGSIDRIGLTDKDAEPEWDGAARFEETHQASFVVNARVRANPYALERLIREALHGSADAFALELTVPHMECFIPARPNPPHRFAEIAL